MEALLKQDQALPPEERARIIEIQDLLIDRFVEHREATEKGQAWRAKELEAEIEELQNEKGKRGEMGRGRFGIVVQIRSSSVWRKGLPDE